MSEWAAVFSTLIAGLGLFFAGGQLLVMNRTAAMERRVARDGVVVSWRPLDAPRVAEADGSAVWNYLVEVYNPGRLPIVDVRVEWYFQCHVQRRRSGHLEPATKVLSLTTPVLAGGGTRPWERRLVMNFAEAEVALPSTYAEVHFVDAEGQRRVNRWPRDSRSSR